MPGRAAWKCRLGFRLYICTCRHLVSSFVSVEVHELIGSSVLENIKFAFFAVLCLKGRQAQSGPLLFLILNFVAFHFWEQDSSNAGCRNTQNVLLKIRLHNPQEASFSSPRNLCICLRALRSCFLLEKVPDAEVSALQTLGALPRRCDERRLHRVMLRDVGVSRSNTFIISRG